MTIEVSIKNNDQSRTVEVIQVSIDKGSGRRTESLPHQLKPGFSTTVHVYLLRDILVREVDPHPK